MMSAIVNTVYKFLVLKKLKDARSRFSFRWHGANVSVNKCCTSGGRLISVLLRQALLNSIADPKTVDRDLILTGFVIRSFDTICS